MSNQVTRLKLQIKEQRELAARLHREGRRAAARAARDKLLRLLHDLELVEAGTAASNGFAVVGDWHA